MRIRLIALPILLLTGLTGCAPMTGPGTASTGASAERQCFLSNTVRNFRTGDEQTLYVRTLGNDVFEISASGVCRDINSALALSIQPEAGSSRVCVGDGANVAYQGGGSSGGCRVRVMQQLTPEQIEALPSRARP